jgi:hypothetical protein
MPPQRAKRILRALGWRQVDLMHELNRVARTTYKSGDIWKWFSGVRDIPLGAAIFLRQQVRVAILKRRLGQQDGPPEMSESTSVAIKELRELADTLECGAAELVDIVFGGDDGGRSSLTVAYRLLRAPAERVLMH